MSVSLTFIFNLTLSFKSGDSAEGVIRYTYIERSNIAITEFPTAFQQQSRGARDRCVGEGGGGSNKREGGNIPLRRQTAVLSPVSAEMPLTLSFYQSTETNLGFSPLPRK